MYLQLLSILGLGVLAVLALRLLARLTAISSTPYVVEPWLSGNPPTEHALSRHHARWYTASVVFLAFDVEMLFMYPWAVVVGRLGTGAVVEMFGFLLALLLAVLWARREGAFRWV
ncbi:MAG: NADH-quinone oxidoreductase subunit A [Marmoricola sp.]